MNDSDKHELQEQINKLATILYKSCVKLDKTSGDLSTLINLLFPQENDDKNGKPAGVA